jgi:NMD protein affecting ribosome stability and mRNA decay
MPYREGAQAAPLLCGICHAATDRHAATVDDAHIALCARCARARRRVRRISYACIGVVIAAGIAAAIGLRHRRHREAPVADDRRIVTREDERIELTRVHRLVEDGRVAEAHAAARAAIARFGASREWSTILHASQGILDDRAKEEAVRRNMQARPEPR